MLKDHTDIQDVMNILGYVDERSLKRWCSSRGIPIINLGLKKYIKSYLLMQDIDNQYLIFEEANKQGADPADIKNIDLKQNSLITNGSYNPENEIILYYLSKYESASKTFTSKKAAA